MSRTSFWSLAILLVSSSSLFAGGKIAGYVPRPSCGPAAVMVWLDLVGRDARVTEVEQAFRDVGVGDPIQSVSAADMAAALTRLGSRAEVLSWPNRRASLRLIPLPCIVHIKDTDDRDVGHFTVLAKIDGDRLWLFDASQDKLMQEQAIDEFLKEWDGVTVCPRGTAFPFAIGAALVVLSVAALGCTVWRTRIPEDKQRNAPSVLAVFATCGISLLGCDRSAPATVPGPPLIRFTEPSRNLGVVRNAGERTEEFGFEVTGDQAVTITEVVPCCGSRIKETTLIGEELLPGSKHSISLIMNVRDDPTPYSVFARIVTEPPSTVPLVVAVHLQYIGPPRLSRSEISFETTPDIVPETSLDVFHWRRPNDRPVTLDRGNCDSAELTIVGEELVTEMTHRSETQMAFDTTHIRLAPKSRKDVGTFHDKLRLQWSDGTQHNVPITIRVSPPVRASPDRAFFGYVVPGSKTELMIPLRATGVVSFDVSKLTSSDEAVAATYDPERQALQISLRAPATPGRFEAEIRIAFQPSGIPEVRLPVSAIVRGVDRAGIRPQR